MIRILTFSGHYVYYSADASYNNFDSAVINAVFSRALCVGK